jgi:hypothetical protein
MQHDRFHGPSDNDDRGGFVGLNQLDGDGVGCGDGAAG